MPHLAKQNQQSFAIEIYTFQSFVRWESHKIFMSTTKALQLWQVNLSKSLIKTFQQSRHISSKSIILAAVLMQFSWSFVWIVSRTTVDALLLHNYVIALTQRLCNVKLTSVLVGSGPHYQPIVWSGYYSDLSEKTASNGDINARLFTALLRSTMQLFPQCNCKRL